MLICLVFGYYNDLQITADQIKFQRRVNWRCEESLQNLSSTLSVWSSTQKSLPLKPRFDFEAIDAIQYLSEQQRVRCIDFWKVESQITLLSHLQKKKKKKLNLGKHSHWSILYSERICQMIHMSACNYSTWPILVSGLCATFLSSQGWFADTVSDFQFQECLLFVSIALPSKPPQSERTCDISSFSNIYTS